MKTISDVQVVLQAGGEGRRIRSVGANLPKPILTIDGVSLIQRLMQQLVAEGFRHFTVVTGFAGAVIQEHVRMFAGQFPANVDIGFYQEPRSMGNAGSVAASAVESRTVLLVFADLFTNISFRKLVTIHRDRASDVTLASHWESHGLTLGELQADGVTVTDYVEKPTKKFLICSGIAAIEPAVLLAAEELPCPYGISELIQLAIKRSLHVSHWIHGSVWMDVNTPETLQAARDFEKQRRQSETRLTCAEVP